MMFTRQLYMVHLFSILFAVGTVEMSPSRPVGGAHGLFALGFDFKQFQWI